MLRRNIIFLHVFRFMPAVTFGIGALLFANLCELHKWEDWHAWTAFGLMMITAAMTAFVLYLYLSCRARYLCDEYHRKPVSEVPREMSCACGAMCGFLMLWNGFLCAANESNQYDILCGWIGVEAVAIVLCIVVGCEQCLREKNSECRASRLEYLEMCRQEAEKRRSIDEYNQRREIIRVEKEDAIRAAFLKRCREEFDCMKETLLDLVLFHAEELRDRSPDITHILKQCDYCQEVIESNWEHAKEVMCGMLLETKRQIGLCRAEYEYSQMQPVICGALPEEVFRTFLRDLTSMCLKSPEDWMAFEKTIEKLHERMSRLHGDRLPVWQAEQEEIRASSYEQVFGADDEEEEFPFDDDDPATAERNVG